MYNNNERVVLMAKVQILTDLSIPCIESKKLKNGTTYIWNF